MNLAWNKNLVLLEQDNVNGVQQNTKRIRIILNTGDVIVL